MSIPLGSQPSTITCPTCNVNVVTRVEHTTTGKTHLIVLGLCLTIGWCLCLPCVFAPYCMASTRNADHYCPNCNTFLGTYVR